MQGRRACRCLRANHVLPYLVSALCTMETLLDESIARMRGKTAGSSIKGLGAEALRFGSVSTESEHPISPYDPETQSQTS
jgi:hypothetical protein